MGPWGGLGREARLWVRCAGRQETYWGSVGRPQKRRCGHPQCAESVCREGHSFLQGRLHVRGNSPLGGFPAPPVGPSHPQAGPASAGAAGVPVKLS
eukprot:1256879-Alexandrium_andersonii.AAC.1